MDVFVSRRCGLLRHVTALRASILVKNDRQLSIGPESAHGVSVSNHAPPHSFEIIFYSTAFLVVALGLTWYFFH
jgi:hypothetical protein